MNQRARFAPESARAAAAKCGAGDSGSALIVVLSLVVMLSLLVMGVALTMQVESRVASLARQGFHCDVLARAGIELAKHQLLDDSDPNYDAAADVFRERWHMNPMLYENHPLGEGTIHVRVEAEDGKLNINTLAALPEAFHHLLELLQVSPADADVLVDSVADWIDLDSLPRLNGAEDEYYEQFSPPYRVKNGPIDLLQEMLLIRGMTRELFYGTHSGRPLREVLTGLSAGKVNVNVAPALVLAVLFGLDEGQAEAIVAHRNGPDGVAGTEDDRTFYAVQDIPLGAHALTAQEAEALQNILDFKSHFFSITSEGRLGRISKTIRVIVSRDDEEIKTLAWVEGPDALR